MPQLGAPFAYVTTKEFLEVFELAMLSELLDIERFEDFDDQGVSGVFPAGDVKAIIQVLNDARSRTAA